MNEPKLFRYLIMVILATITCCSLIFFSLPLDAKTKNFNQMLDLGIIDKTTPPQEFNFDYLQQSPPPLNVALMDNVRLADRKAAQLPEDGLVGIPLGSAGPIPVKSELPALKFTLKQPGRFIAIGSGNRSDGTTSPISVGDVRDMFAIEKQIGGFGGISQEDTNKEQIVADASGTFLEARRPIVHDILILDQLTGQMFIRESVLMSTICRETVNAFLTDSYYYKDY